MPSEKDNGTRNTQSLHRLIRPPCLRRIQDRIGLRSGLPFRSRRRISLRREQLTLRVSPSFSQSVAEPRKDLGRGLGQQG
jgi:hypothetical protein